MKATLLIHEKFIYPDGAIREIKVWQVPAVVPGSAHVFKYRLFYGRNGERIVGYDNERGKGDHRHFQDAESLYTFTTVRQLVADFAADIAAVRRKP